MSDETYSHIGGSWVDHFRSVLSSTNSRLAFNQIPLATFNGHTGAIRQILVLDNENSFMSSAADKTIKLWSIKTTEAVSNCQWTYKNHQKTILDYVLMTSNGLVASTDSTVHVTFLFLLFWASGQHYCRFGIRFVAPPSTTSNGPPSRQTTRRLHRLSHLPRCRINCWARARTPTASSERWMCAPASGNIILARRRRRWPPPPPELFKCARIRESWPLH